MKFQAINLAHNQAEYKAISEAVQGVIFLGTPHKGSPLANWGKVVPPWSTFWRKDLIKLLQPDSEILDQIAKYFRERAGSLLICSYYERIKYDKGGIIVPKTSALLQFPRERQYPMEHNHVTMCRFPGKVDKYYGYILQDLRDCIENQPMRNGGSLELVQIEKYLQALRSEVVKQQGTPETQPSQPKLLGGTCEWLFGVPSFQKWLSPSAESGLFWLTGPYGCGKTMLSKFVAENLSEYVFNDASYSPHMPTTVCYYSCDHNSSGEADVSRMLNALLYQILTANQNLACHAIRDWKKHGQECGGFKISEHVLHDTLKDPRADCFLIIVDAIDKCEEAVQQLYINFLKSLSDVGESPANTSSIVKGRTRVLFTSQRTEETQIRLRDVPSYKLEDLPCSQYIQQDVKMFIQDEVEKLSRTHNYSVTNKDFVESKLKERAGHNFLWVKFVIQELDKLWNSSRNQLEKTIENVPTDLEERYRTFLTDLARDKDRLLEVVKLTKLISASFERLDLESLGFAMALRNNHPSQSEVEHLVNPDVSAIAPALIQVIDGRVQFIHSSFKSYLSKLSKQETDSRLAAYAFTFEEMHLEMARICTAYLSLEDFERADFDLTPHESMNMDQSPVFEHGEFGIRSLFRHEAYGRSGKRPTFFDYCALHWTTHVARAGYSIVEDSGFVETIMKICEKNSYILRNWLDCYWSTLAPRKQRPQNFDPLVVSSFFGLELVVRHLIDKGLVNTSISGPAAVYWAAMEGKSKIVDDLLLEKVSSSFEGPSGWTPLICAAAAGHVEVIESLLSTGGADINAKTPDGRTALSYAVNNCHLPVTKSLLQHDDIDVNKTDDGKDTPLIYCTNEGDLEIFKLLLDTHKVDLNRAGYRGRTALSYAAEHGFIELTRILLEQPFDLLDPELPDDAGLTPMLYAAKNGRLEIMQLLLDESDVNIKLKDNKGLNAVLHASKYHHIHVLKFLQKEDPDGFEEVDEDGTTALGFALIEAGRKRLETIECLLKSKLVRPNGPNGDRAALFRAATTGFVQGVEILIKRGANANAVNNSGKTPLECILDDPKRPDPEVVHCLLKGGASIDRIETFGMTLFEYVVLEMPNPEIISLLVDAGAKIDEIDGKGKTLLQRVLLKEDDKQVHKQGDKQYHEQDDTEMVTSLLEAGANPNVKTNDGLTLLHHVVDKSQSHKTITSLIKGGADPNARTKDGLTPLHLIAEKDQSDKAVARLLKKRTGTNVRSNGGLLPLHIVVDKDQSCKKFQFDEDLAPEVRVKRMVVGKDQRLDMVACLLKKGAYLNVKTDDGLTPLHLIVDKNHDHRTALLDKSTDPKARTKVIQAQDLDNVACLLEGGADPNARTKDGSTPVHILASKCQSPEMVTYLLSNGANPKLKNSKWGGLTPLEYGKTLKCPNKEIMQVLEEREIEDVKKASWASWLWFWY